MLGMSFASLFSVFGLVLKGQTTPISEEACHVFHTMVSVEESSHGIKEVLVAMQVFFFLDQLEFKASTYRLVLQTVIILNIINQLLEQVSAVVDLQKGCVLLLV